jgi:hypothetical protein
LKPAKNVELTSLVSYHIIVQQGDGFSSTFSLLCENKSPKEFAIKDFCESLLTDGRRIETWTMK